MGLKRWVLPASSYGRPHAYGLPLRLAPAAGGFEQLAFQVQHHHRLQIRQQHRNRDAGGLTRAGRADSDDVLGAAQPQVMALILADQDALRRARQQSGLFQVGQFREARIAVQRFGLALEDRDQQYRPHQQWQAEADGAGRFYLADVRRDLRQIQRLKVLPPGVPGHGHVFQPKHPQHQPVREVEAAHQGRQQQRQCKNQLARTHRLSPFRGESDAGASLAAVSIQMDVLPVRKRPPCGVMKAGSASRPISGRFQTRGKSAAGHHMSEATFNSSLPRWLPSNRRLMTSGAFSRPSATVSSALSLPSRIQPANACTASLVLV